MASAEGLSAMLPRIKLKSGMVDFWQFRRKRNREDFREELLKFNDVFVTCLEVEIHIGKVREPLEGAKQSDEDDESGSVMHHMAKSSECVDLLEMMLGLGMDPNVVNYATGRTPAHECSCHGNIPGAQALRACRPDLTDVDDEGMTAEKRARHTANSLTAIFKRTNYEEVADVWEEATAVGFPKLAQLASEKKWFAVKNLCRRRCLESKEKDLTYRGRTALQWAEIHGQRGMQEELLYFFQPLQLPSASAAVKPQLEPKRSTEIKLVTRMSAVESEQKETKSKLKAVEMSLRSEVSLIRAMLESLVAEHHHHQQQQEDRGAHDNKHKEVTDDWSHQVSELREVIMLTVPGIREAQEQLKIEVAKLEQELKATRKDLMMEVDKLRMKIGRLSTMTHRDQ